MPFCNPISSTTDDKRVTFFFRSTTNVCRKYFTWSHEQEFVFKIDTKAKCKMMSSETLSTTSATCIIRFVSFPYVNDFLAWTTQKYLFFSKSLLNKRKGPHLQQ